MQKISELFFDAMFNPSTGYYRTKNPIGKDCDFITAPEISQTFGETIASYLLQIASAKKSPIALVEMGAGKGTLFFDVVNSIKKLAEKNINPAVDFIARTTFHIVEINPVLREIQQQKLRDFTISWYENFSEISFENREIFFLSNELFDCFAIDQFVLTEVGWRERVTDGNFFSLANFDKKIHDFIEKEIAGLAPIGAVFEYSKSGREFMTQLCESLKTQGGIAINIDYGYEKKQFANTLQALKNHQKVEVLKTLGGADLTAHVDFGALRKIAEKFTLNSSLITQREFLLSLGIEERRKILLAKNPAQSRQINSAIDRLIGSDQMGELFKCLIVWK